MVNPALGLRLARIQAKRDAIFWRALLEPAVRGGTIRLWQQTLQEINGMPNYRRHLMTYVRNSIPPAPKNAWS